MNRISVGHGKIGHGRVQKIWGRLGDKEVVSGGAFRKTGECSRISVGGNKGNFAKKTNRRGSGLSIGNLRHGPDPVSSKLIKSEVHSVRDIEGECAIGAKERVYLVSGSLMKFQENGKRYFVGQGTTWNPEGFELISVGKIFVNSDKQFYYELVDGAFLEEGLGLRLPTIGGLFEPLLGDNFDHRTLKFLPKGEKFSFNKEICSQPMTLVKSGFIFKSQLNKIFFSD